jgi:hypothetical protein
LHQPGPIEQETRVCSTMEPTIWLKSWWAKGTQLLTAFDRSHPRLSGVFFSGLSTVCRSIGEGQVEALPARGTFDDLVRQRLPLFRLLGTGFLGGKLIASTRSGIVAPQGCWWGNHKTYSFKQMN